MSDDPFAPIGGGNGGGKRPRLRVVGDGDGDWAPAWPLAAGAPEAPHEHPTLGAPSGRWPYLDAEGRTLGYVLRFDTPEGKQFRPLTPWRKGKASAIVWRWISWSEPRPLYGLDDLATRPDAPVAVCEGEKSADAARRLLPGFVAIASPGGARAASKADWRPLAGRQVTVWRDADEPGAQYAADVASACAAARAAAVAIAEPPEGVDEGWDAADAEEEGWTPERAEAFVAAAKPVSASGQGAQGKVDEGASDAAKAPRRGVGAILALLARKNVKFWHSPAKDAFATVRVDDHNETYRLESREFARYLAGIAYFNGITPPSKATLDDALRVFAAQAINIGPEKEPIKRVGARDGKWYLDLGDDRWRVVEIDDAGWRVLTNHDLPIVRSLATRPLPEPEANDSPIGLFRGFVNSDDETFKLIVAWLLAALCPHGPYPILIVNGEQGSAKSTLCRTLRSLVDPNIAPLRAMPKDETNLLVAAMHSHVLALDNVSQITGELSDALCRIATGGGFSVRVLFTTSDEFVAYLRNAIILNGIPSLTGRPDLASRAIVVRLKHIPEETRKTEAEFDAEWAAAAPKVLAILLDVLSSAMRKLPDVKLARVSRMADFERLIIAACPALGWDPEEFRLAYRDNQSDVDATAIESDPVAGAIVALIEKDFPMGWEGNATRLYDVLGEKVSDNTRRSRAWPMSAISLGSRLERLKPVLRRNGVVVEKRHSGDRFITIRPATPPAEEN
jgi:hypothetical protein